MAGKHVKEKTSFWFCAIIPSSHPGSAHHFNRNRSQHRDTPHTGGGNHRSSAKAPRTACKCSSARSAWRWHVLLAAGKSGTAPKADLQGLSTESALQLLAGARTGVGACPTMGRSRLQGHACRLQSPHLINITVPSSHPAEPKRTSEQEGSGAAPTRGYQLGHLPAQQPHSPPRAPAPATPHPA